jgi:hypothetical protein
VKADTQQAEIEHRIAELRAAYPRIGACHASLEDWREGATRRYALQLDIRWPQHQSLIAGPARGSAEQAIEDAFRAAARGLEQAHA